VARDSEGGVGGVEEGGLLGSRFLRQGFAQSTLALEQRGLGLSDLDIGSVAGLSAFLYKALRRLPHRMGFDAYLRRQHRAAEEMGANGFGEIPATPRTHIRSASAQDVCA
jgi:hypothetical protein